MIQAKLLSRSGYQRSLWKNGLGHTDQIAIEPEGADLRKADFLFRLSSAQIEQSSAFSAFPAHDRTIVILKGTGIRLIHTFPETGEEDANEIPALEPFDFPGDLPSRCELMDGPVLDLGLFVRKGEVEAFTEVVPLEEATSWSPSGQTCFLHAVGGEIRVSIEAAGDSMEHHLSEGDTLRLDLSEPWGEMDRLELRSDLPSCAAVAVSLQSAN